MEYPPNTRKLEVNADTEVQPIIGVIFRPWDQFRLAGVWRRGGSPVKLLGKGGGAAVIASVELPMNLSLAFRDFFTPDEFAGSIAYSRWRVAAVLGRGTRRSISR